MQSPLGTGLRATSGPGLDSSCYPTGNGPEQYMSPLLGNPTPSYLTPKLEPSIPQSSAQVLPPTGGSVHHTGYMQVH